MPLKPHPIDRAFQFIEPGPVVLVSTSHRGVNNVMTMSWHMAIDFSPKIACVIGPWDHSYAALRATKECVIAVPTVDMAKQVIKIGNCSGKDVDKFKAFKLATLPAKDVQAPLIMDCLANIECKVCDTSLFNKYNIFILQGVRAWSDPKRKERRTIHANGNGTFVVDGRTLDLRKMMVKWLSII